MKIIKYTAVALFCFLSIISNAQNVHHFFIDDVYQRNYFNPALNNDHTLSFATGFGAAALLNGPGFKDFTRSADGGGLILDPENAITEMNDVNDIFASASVHTFDASIDLKVFRVSVGHAWKANGWIQYTKDLAEVLTYGNAPYIGETLNLGLPIDYINYNEVYLGLQKSFGPLSLGTRIKRLSGVQTIQTERSKIDFTTSDDIYQLTLDTDLLINTSSALDYTEIDSFDISIDNISFENILSKNTGWAFDFGASIELGDRLEVSIGALDIGSIEWTENPENLTSFGSKTQDGVDLSDIIVNDDDVVIEDSLRALLEIEETNNAFSTSLPSQIYLGAQLKVNDALSVGALIQTVGSDDRRASSFSLNASYKLSSWLTAGGLYSAKKGNAANFGLYFRAKVGPVYGFISTDSITGITSGLDSKGSNLRMGVSVGI